MRSVFVHLWNTSDRPVAAALDRLFPGPGPAWVAERSGDPYLYINFYRDGPLEDEQWFTRFKGRGGPPAVSVVADVSGRHDGWVEARAFIVGLLGLFDGAATDDDWLRLWSCADVAADRRVDGRRFGCWRNPATGAAAE